MRVTTWNVNGLRAALRKGLHQHLAELNTDVLLLQEIRCRPEQLPNNWQFPDLGEVLFHPADRPGYAGTAIWSRYPINEIARGLNSKGDTEGRVLVAEIRGVTVMSIYSPSGTSGEHRQKIKEQWMRSFARWNKSFRESSGPVLIGGDLNIAHTERDIFHAKSNQNTSGFLPHEREWIGRLFKSGWQDTVRQWAGNVHGPYSWWSNRGQARELDRGWRIDYILANNAAASSVKVMGIQREMGLAISDHAPVTVEIDV